MSIAGLNWAPVTIRFDGSLETRGDVRLGAPPDFDLLRDAQFEDVGGLQTRPPFGSVMGSGSIFGGGTLASCRKLAVVNGELCLFTSDSLYSWNAQLSAWVLRGTHLAVSVDEAPRFGTAGDQIDGDRAELSGTVVCVWTEGTQVYAAAFDKVTKSVLVSPTAVSTAIGRPRLVALATKILFFVEASTTLLTVRAIDPAAPGTAIAGAGTTVLATNFNLNYDVARAGTQDLVVGACERQTTSSYEAFTVTPGLVVTNSTKARTCDGPIAVSAIPDGTKTQIVRRNGTDIQGDLLTTSSLADVFTGQAIGTTDNLAPVQIAAAHRSVQNGGAFRCYVFWTYPINIFLTPRTRSNWVDTANSLGTQALFAEVLTVASRAFDYAGSVYLWLAFGEATTFSGSGSGSFRNVQLQNTYFLYRDDGLLSNAKCVATHGGGAASTAGRLPAVSLTSGSSAFAWCATERRRFDAGGEGHVDFAARAPVDVTFTFDSNDARRSTQLGAALYVSGGEILAYDGVRLVEVGFHIYPWTFVAANAAGGSIDAGTYTYKVTWRYRYATGEGERSTTATTAEVTVSTGRVAFTFIQPLVPTHKLVVPPAAEMWRTQSTAGEGAPFFLVSSNNPTSLTNPNRYLPNDPTAAALPTFNDDLADASIDGNETNPENDSILEALAPPAAAIIVPTETRLLLAGIAGEPDAWWYSRERGDGEIASFHDELRVEVPPVGGAIAALWADDQFVYVGRETAIYAYAGPGKTNGDEGQNFTLVRTISRDVGVVSQEAHAPTPVGRLLKSSKGWYILDGGGNLRYVGGAVSDFDTDTVVAVHTITAKHQVRILTTSRLLVWDYRGLIAATSPGPGRWSEWTVTGGLDAVLYNGVYTILTTTGPKQESASFTGLTYGLDAQLAWIKPADLMGAVAVRAIQALGEYRSAFLLRMRIAYNYDETVVDDVVWNPSPTTVGGPLQMVHGPKRRQCEAIRVRLTAVAAGAQATVATASGLSHVVATSGTNWAATFAAKTGNYSVIGELGNNVTMSIAFESGAANIIDVRDHFTYDQATGLWSPDLLNVGVRVVCTAATLTVAALETAIAAGTDLIQVSVADATPSKTIDAAVMAGIAATGIFTGGTFTSPTGEALKLSGLALEVGIVRPTFKRLPRAQRA